MWGTQSIVVILIVGLIAGWLAGKLMRGSGFGIIGDIVIGIIGAVIGTWLFSLVPSIPIPLNIVGDIIKAVIGAVILLFVIGLIKR